LAAADGVLVYAPSLDEIARRWKEIEPLLRRATDRSSGAYETIDVLRQVLNQQLGLWLVTNHDFAVAVAVTEIVNHPRKRVLTIRFIGGHGMRQWYRQLFDCFDNQARQACCEVIVAEGRKGWGRTSLFGFDPVNVTFQRQVPPIPLIGD